jgi:hypothetical protein
MPLVKLLVSLRMLDQTPRFVALFLLTLMMLIMLLLLLLLMLPPMLSPPMVPWPCASGAASLFYNVIGARTLHQ